MGAPGQTEAGKGPGGGAVRVGAVQGWAEAQGPDGPASRTMSTVPCRGLQHRPLAHPCLFQSPAEQYEDVQQSPLPGPLVTPTQELQGSA